MVRYHVKVLYVILMVTKFYVVFRPKIFSECFDRHTLVLLSDLLKKKYISSKQSSDVNTEGLNVWINSYHPFPF